MKPFFGHYFTSCFISCALMAFIVCTSPENPMNNPENADIFLVVPDTSTNTITVGDTIALVIALQLDNLIDSVELIFGDELDTIINVFTDTITISHITGDIGEKLVRSLAYISDGSLKEDSARINIHSIPLQIISHPSNASVLPGYQAVFTVTASGIPAPAYQWYCDSMLLPGENDDTLIIDSVTNDIDGVHYWAEAANEVDTVKSNPAVLHILSAASLWNAFIWNSGVWH
ncbi:MAG: hypothetical protein GF350_11570 [Chitinivibrionales bacterium]|nr:hypothetical protein [Chitinivibrionales bacterium]